MSDVDGYEPNDKWKHKPDYGWTMTGLGHNYVTFRNPLWGEYRHDLNAYEAASLMLLESINSKLDGLVFRMGPLPEPMTPGDTSGRRD